jgi:hypothetical protein
LSIVFLTSFPQIDVAGVVIGDDGWGWRWIMDGEMILWEWIGKLWNGYVIIRLVIKGADYD